MDPVDKRTKCIYDFKKNNQMMNVAIRLSQSLNS